MQAVANRFNRVNSKPPAAPQGCAEGETVDSAIHGKLRHGHATLGSELCYPFGGTEQENPSP